MPFITSKASSGGSSLSLATLTISAAQFLALHDTPLQIVAAPGAGKINVPILVDCVFLPGDTPYADGGTVRLGANPAAGDNTGLISAGDVAGSLPLSVPQIADQIHDLTGYTNAALLVWAATQNFTAGNGTARVFLTYVTVTT